MLSDLFTWQFILGLVVGYLVLGRLIAAVSAKLSA